MPQTNGDAPRTQSDSPVFLGAGQDIPVPIEPVARQVGLMGPISEECRAELAEIDRHVKRC